MLQLRWVTKIRKVMRETNPGYYGGPMFEVGEKYRVLQYREVVEKYRVLQYREVVEAIATEWQDVPDAGEIAT